MTSVAIQHQSNAGMTDYDYGSEFEDLPACIYQQLIHCEPQPLVITLLSYR